MNSNSSFHLSLKLSSLSHATKYVASHCFSTGICPSSPSTFLPIWSRGSNTGLLLWLPQHHPIYDDFPYKIRRKYEYLPLNDKQCREMLINCHCYMFSHMLNAMSTGKACTKYDGKRLKWTASVVPRELRNGHESPHGEARVARFESWLE